ncbi:hypothetical protein KKF82_08020 [Patescibacteria group bacterium]|uniref:Uncharacterized protein n=1 Tax=viral metagenome TaxID=1070528 RepID=A0A6M3M5V3_9ZZZZ|nr:hypothetical protein [Patescibacteria group bacterium]
MEKEQLKQIVDETFHFLNNKGVNFICYIWDRDGECGGGCNCADADVGDALVAIEKIVKHFNIDTDRLYTALMGIKAEQQGN